MSTSAGVFDSSSLNEKETPPFSLPPSYAQAVGGGHKERAALPLSPLNSQAQGAGPNSLPVGYDGRNYPTSPHPGFGGGPAPGRSHTASVPFQAAGFHNSAAVQAQWLVAGHPNAAGLNLLDGVGQVTVERVVDMMDAAIRSAPMSWKRQFRVLNRTNQQIFFLDEDESFLINGMQRAFRISAKNSYGQVVFEVSREGETCPCCFCCACLGMCRSEAKISDSRSNLIGLLQQRPSFDRAEFVVLNRENTEVLAIHGDCALCVPNTHYEFEMQNGGQPGFMDKVGSHWGTALNKYTLTFPPSANSEIKACCLGTLVLFDFRFHLIPQNRERR